MHLAIDAPLSESVPDSEGSDPSSAYRSALEYEQMHLSRGDDIVLQPQERPGLYEHEFQHQLQPQRDTSDWQFLPDLFSHYDVRYGPFQVDATADDAGRNAMCPAWWSPPDSYSQHVWARCKIWCNPPFDDISAVLSHAIASFKTDPDNTCALLVLPDWPDSSWWPRLTQSGVFHCVGYYPSGSHLFTAAPRGNAGQRRDMGPTRWGVIMAITGKSWGTGICIPWEPWPPTHPPTVPNVHAPAQSTMPPELPTVNPGIDEMQRQQVQRLVADFPGIWASGSVTGRTNWVTHRIPTGEAAPIKARPRRMTQQEMQVSRGNTVNMEASQTIVRSHSAWASVPVMIQKGDGTVRYCIDFRPLNEVTVKDVYPIPHMDDVLDSLGNAQYFTKIDLKSGYWQIVVEPSDRHKTAFITREGLFEFVVMPFGLTSAPATFQRLMDTLLGDLLYKTVMVYLDDIVIYTKTWEEHLAMLDEVFQRLRAAGLKASPSKCEIAQEQLLYLGHMVTREGILPDPSNVQAILHAAPPVDVTGIKSFLGMTAYYSVLYNGMLPLLSRYMHCSGSQSILSGRRNSKRLLTG